MPESRKTGVSATWITCATLSTLSNPSMYGHRAEERLGFEQTFSETSIEAAKTEVTVAVRIICWCPAARRPASILAADAPLKQRQSRIRERGHIGEPVGRSRLQRAAGAEGT